MSSVCFKGHIYNRVNVIVEVHGRLRVVLAGVFVDIYFGVLSKCE
jgi:hypothetical protein